MYVWLTYIIVNYEYFISPIVRRFRNPMPSKHNNVITIYDNLLPGMRELLQPVMNGYIHNDYVCMYLNLQGLSVLARTGNGLAHTFTKLELHGLGITSLDLIGN